MEEEKAAMSPLPLAGGVRALMPPPAGAEWWCRGLRGGGGSWWPYGAAVAAGVVRICLICAFGLCK